MKPLKFLMLILLLLVLLIACSADNRQSQISESEELTSAPGIIEEEPLPTETPFQTEPASTQNIKPSPTVLPKETTAPKPKASPTPTAYEAAEAKAEPPLTQTAAQTPEPAPTAAQETAAEITENPDSQTVYITDTGKKYHKNGCRYLDASQHAILLENAVKRGYEPCKVCKP